MTQETPPRPLIRPVIALIAAGALLVVTAALLSDRVPNWLGIARNRFDAPGWFPWTLDETAFHLIMWFGVTLLATLAVRTTGVRMIVGGAMVLASPIIEYLQTYLTATRSFQISDIVANTQGVFLGLLIGLLLGAAADTIEAHRDLAVPHRATGA